MHQDTTFHVVSHVVLFASVCGEEEGFFIVVDWAILHVYSRNTQHQSHLFIQATSGKTAPAIEVTTFTAAMLTTSDAFLHTSITIYTSS